MSKSKNNNDRKNAMVAQARAEKLKKMRKEGIIDRATFRMISQQEGLKCARKTTTPKGGTRIPERTMYLTEGKEETTSGNWCSKKQTPLYRV